MHGPTSFSRFSVIASLFLLSAIASTSLTAQFTAAGSVAIPASTTQAFVLKGAAGAADEIVYFDTTTVPPSIVTLSTASGTLVQTSSSPALGLVGLIRSGDMDGDGLTDVVVFSGNQYCIYRRITTGFALLTGPIAALVPPVSDRRIHVFDIDNDGDLDVVDRSYYFTNSGSGTMTGGTSSFASAIGLTESQVADFNADGYDDVIYHDFHTVRVANAVIDGPVPFEILNQVEDTDSFVWNVLDADVDGIPDYVSLNVAAAPTATNFVRGLGGGAFAAPILRPVPAAMTAAGVQEMDIADIDGDGRNEIIATVASAGGAAGATAVYSVDLTGALVPFTPSGTPVTGLSMLSTGDLDADGRMDIFGIVPGTTPTISAFRSTAAARPFAVNVISGDGQTITALDATTVPVTIEVFDNVAGAPAAGVNVLLSGDAGLTVSTVSGSTTNALGRVQFNVLGSLSTGRKRIRVSLADGTTKNILVTVIPPATLNFVSGAGQIGYLNSTPLSPMIVSATRLNGTAYVGGPVTFSVSTGLSLPSGASPATTDSQGLASVTPNASLSGYKNVTARLGTGGRSPRVQSTITVRSFSINHVVGTTGMGIIYAHEDGPTPFLLAADLPRTPIATPFGSVATSVLAPLPGFVALDGLGYFGPPNSTAVANPLYFLFTSGIPPAILGQTLVFQIYGFDPTYAYPQSIFVTPALNVLL